MDERIQEGSFKQPSFKPQQRPGKARRAAVSAEKTMAAVKGKRSSSVVDITTAPKGPPKPDEVLLLARLLALLLARPLALLLAPLSSALLLRLLLLQVVAMLRKAVDSCLLFGGMTLAQCDVVINTMLPHSFSAGDCMIEQGTSSSDDLHFYIVGKGTFDIHRKEASACAKVAWPFWLTPTLPSRIPFPRSYPWLPLGSCASSCLGCGSGPRPCCGLTRLT